MTAKRFSKYVPDSYNYTSIITIVDHKTNKRSGSIDDFVDMMNVLYEENEQLKIELKDKENLISICEKKFKELGYLITCDDDGYVIE